MAILRNWRFLAKCAFGVILSTQAGCMCLCPAVPTPSPEELAVTSDVALCQKLKVFTFFIHGCDPLDYSNLQGLREYLHSIGYIKTYFGNSYHTFHFRKEVCKLRKEQPDARIVLVGFSHGCVLARDLACSVREDGIDIDLLVYLDGGEVAGVPLHKPYNVARVVNVVSCKKQEYQVKDAENHVFEDIGHCAVPTDKRTVCLISRELADVARRVPIIRPLLPFVGPPTPLQQSPTLPPPKEISKGRGEWDFLRPDEYTLGSGGVPPMEQALTGPPATLSRRH